MMEKEPVSEKFDLKNFTMVDSVQEIIISKNIPLSKTYRFKYKYLIYPLMWSAHCTYQTHMQSFHAARSGRAAAVRMVERNAERTRIRMGTQNSSTPPRIESFHLRTVDTAHESSPGTPTITHRCGNGWKACIF
jgi:hypothetical protein